MSIARTTSKARYEMIYVEIKLFRRIGIGGEHSGNFIHLNVDPEKRKTLPGLVEGGGRNSGKQLVFMKSKHNTRRNEAVHGASLPIEFERQGMAKIFNKKIKTWFPILFKGVLDFHLMKAKGRA